LFTIEIIHNLQTLFETNYVWKLKSEINKLASTIIAISKKIKMKKNTAEAPP